MTRGKRALPFVLAIVVVVPLHLFLVGGFCTAEEGLTAAETVVDCSHPLVEALVPSGLWLVLLVPVMTGIPAGWVLARYGTATLELHLLYLIAVPPVLTFYALQIALGFSGSSFMNGLSTFWSFTSLPLGAGGAIGMSISSLSRQL